jgi:hypothetical protein
MAKYLILIYGEEKTWDAMTEAEWAKIDAGHRAFRETAESTGVTVRSAGQLESATTATTLRGGEPGRPVPTDGPFLETKEGLGGFYVVEAADLDAAIAVAGNLHEVYAGHSAVEIRPLVER